MIQREIEKAGISTISITFSKEISTRLKPPRAVYTGLPLGHPFALPDQAFRQINILRILLEQLETMRTPGEILEINMADSDDPDITCAVCGT